MNARIKEIADEADHHAITPGQEWDIRKFTEKFTELFLNDCYKIINEAEKDFIDAKQSGRANGANEVKKRIKKHFKDKE
jgi:hypothetical protein